MIPPSAERHRSKVVILTAWQAAFFVLLATSVTLASVAYVQIENLKTRMEEIQKSCQR